MTRKKFIPPRSLSGSTAAASSTVSTSTATASTLSSVCVTNACFPVSDSGAGVDSRLVAKERLLQVQSAISKVSKMRDGCCRMLEGLERMRLGLLRKEISGLLEEVGVVEGSIRWDVTAGGCSGLPPAAPLVVGTVSLLVCHIRL